MEKNIKLTKAVCDICNGLDIPVEGELGHVGTTKDEQISEYTNVDEAVRFVSETGVSALTVMVANRPPAAGGGISHQRTTTKNNSDTKRAAVPLVSRGLRRENRPGPPAHP